MRHTKIRPQRYEAGFPPRVPAPLTRKVSEMSRRLTVLLVGATMCALTLAYASAALADDGLVCEFPAQSVQLQRPVDITNGAPQIVSVETDVCGNIIGYTEQMTGTMTAGPWVPVSVDRPNLSE